MTSLLLQGELPGCRDGSAAKRTGCLCGGPGLSSQSLHGGSQTSGTPFLGGSDSLLGLQRAPAQREDDKM